MPAYRSEAEAEIRGAVVEHLRLIRPNARIMHEVNAGSYGNRIDVLAVDVCEIITVEIKSAKDKLARLPEQVKAMRGVSNIVVAALHEKFLQTHRNGAFHPPEEANGAITWAFPRIARAGHVHCGEEWRDFEYHRPPSCLPPGALMMLWAAELQGICARLGVPKARSLAMPKAADAIRWRLTGEEIAREVCAALRARRCIEVDPEIEWRAA